MLREENSETFTAAKGAIIERALLDLLEEVIEDVGHSDEVLKKTLRHLLDTKPDIIARFVDTTKKRLLEGIARRALRDVADTETTVQRARALIRDDNGPVLRAVDELNRRLILEIARRSKSEVTDIRALAYQAQALISKEHETILQTVDLVKEQLLRTIVRESVARLHDDAVPSREPDIDPIPPPTEPPVSYMTRPRVLKLHRPERSTGLNTPDASSS